MKKFLCCLICGFTLISVVACGEAPYNDVVQTPITETFDTESASKEDLSDLEDASEKELTGETDAKENQLVKQEEQRMFMLDDKLYVDTGEIANIPRCGNMDFELTSSVEQGVPSENGQTNFGIGYTGQYGTRSNRKDVLINEDWHVFAYNENNLEGVTMEVIESTESSITVQLKNETDLQIDYGEYYLLEWYDENLKCWGYAPTVDDVAFHDIAYMLKKGEPSEWSVDVSNMYGKLEPGRYRIIKEVMDYRAPGDYTVYTLTDEFNIK